MLTVVAAIVLLGACRNDRDGLDNRIDIALELAGDNRAELENVLDHYREDCEKLRAARFLIANMPGHVSYADTVAVNRFYDKVDSMTRQFTGDRYQSFRKKVDKYSQDYDRSTFGIRPDIEIISAGFLIDNIDRAFKTWRTSPYCRHLDFEDFCEYILPYKSGELQALDDWREQYGGMFADSLRLTRYCRMFANSSFRAAETFNHCLIDSFHPIVNYAKPFLPYRLSSQLLVPFGTCDDYCRAAIPLFRSAGIPVMNDYVPRWGYSSSSHGWLVVKAQTGYDIPFVPFFGNPKEQHKIDETKAKVYRRTYSPDPALVELNSSDEWVPKLFRNIFQRDVTREYVKPHSVTVDINGCDGRHAYLAISDHTEWDPVAVTAIKDGKGVFDNLGAGCVYMPVVYDRNGTPYYPSAPFILNLDGSVKHLEPVDGNTTRATLYRKYPLLEYAWNMAVPVVDCRFEASDDADFGTYTGVGVVTEPPCRAGEIKVPETTGAKRYWRFISRGVNARCYMAELAFYRRGNGERLSGQVFQDDHSLNHRWTSPEYLLDNDILQSFSADGEGEAWIAVDFGKPVDIDRIQYTPRADGNTIEPGDDYGLYFWNRDHWQRLGRKTATTVSIDFDNIPTGALLLLRDHTKGKDERIFTLTDDCQQIFH